MCLSVHDGCGRSRNEFAVRVQNHHVRFSFHRNGHNFYFLRYYSKSCCRSGQVWTLCVAGYAKDAIVGACHRTIDEQEHKIICRAGPEQDTIFHLRVIACREQGNHCRDEQLAGVASRWQGTSCSSSFVSKVLGANYNRAIITTFIL